MCKPASGPPLETLDHGVRVRKMIGENISGLRRPWIYHQIFCRQRGESRALLPDEAQGQVM